eukprot:CAMPEP_0176227024 /NCGR_PEP_ID=MMETSP0121_2-20121125/22559_1 /TAXON_ID=160619 /ORGANISM="Kryptoperidinium foliaceum, Strain CCMP 1326" /LENGTH=190 /DNA_ID=CAMNT_0017566301 /DNA_START=72 /DNA_END=641 /DNA_ORIENTATION=+
MARATASALLCLALLAPSASASSDACGPAGCDEVDDLTSLLAITGPSKKHGAPKSSGPVLAVPPRQFHDTLFTAWPWRTQSYAGEFLGLWTHPSTKNTWTFTKGADDKMKAEEANFLWHISELEPVPGGQGVTYFMGPVMAADDIYTQRIFRFHMRQERGQDILVKEWQHDHSDSWDGPIEYERCGGTTG